MTGRDLQDYASQLKSYIIFIVDTPVTSFIEMGAEDTLQTWRPVDQNFHFRIPCNAHFLKITRHMQLFKTSERKDMNSSVLFL
jgi:hypothetical protein